MSYLEEFQLHINQHHYDKLIPLWEEYCANDQVDGHELLSILKTIQSSKFAAPFGKKVEEAIVLWQQIADKNAAHEVLKLIIDLQTTNNKQLADMVYQYLADLYGTQKYFNDKIRIIGLKQKEQFQGAVRNYEFLSHMEAGKFVYHTGGWGTGEIVNLSLVREQISVDFENLSGKKEIAFEHAFRTLIALPNEHFLVQRFAKADELEEVARKDGAKIIQLLLQDLGPKTAAEIKDELCDSVIPEKDWSKWWQQTRSKIKKDVRIETPENLRQPFRLHTEEISHESRLFDKLKEIDDVNQFIQATYNFFYDFPEVIKQSEVKSALQAQLNAKIAKEHISEIQKIQLHILWEEIVGLSKDSELEQMVVQNNNIEQLLQQIEITAFKKRILVLVRNKRADWQQIFLSIIFTLPQHSLRDYLFKELSTPAAVDKLKDKLKQLLENPTEYPIAFVWYFQKVVGSAVVPLQDATYIPRFFESFLILLCYLESQQKYREMVRKMYSILSSNRYAIVREIIEKSSCKQVEEFLLLTTKCSTFNDHDLKILQSLAEIAYPQLAKNKKFKEPPVEEQIIWTTEESFIRIKDRLSHIATVETIENAKEIETARALGDLRENSEFKFALEKRARLQSELATLTKQLAQARVLTKDDITTNKVGVGTIVSVQDNAEKIVDYTLLGPWDADPEKNILSIYSKFAQTLEGAQIDDVVRFQDEEYTIKDIKNYLAQIHA